MNFSELIKERYSVRKFSRKKVEQEKLNIILEAGRIAPTAVNYQPQRILVIEDEQSLNKIRECTPFHFYAPIVLLICYDNTVSWKRSYDQKDEGIIDASIVTTHMMLQAHELGLGTTWVGHFNPDVIIEKFNIPNNFIPISLLPVGYPSEDAKPHQLHYNRFDKEHTVFYNSFDKISEDKK